MDVLTQTYIYGTISSISSYIYQCIISTMGQLLNDRLTLNSIYIQCLYVS